MDTVKNLAYNVPIDADHIQEHFKYLEDNGYLEHVKNGFYRLTLHGKVFVQTGGFTKKRLSRSISPLYSRLNILVGIANLLLLIYLWIKRK